MSSLARVVACSCLLSGACWPAPVDSGPQPPCGSEASPPYPEVDQPPVVKTWENSRDWKAPECTGWEEPGYSTLVAVEPWPRLEPDLLLENTVTLPVQINGKKRAEVTVARDATNAEIEAAVLKLDAVKQALDGKPPKKVIVVPHRIVNVVA